MFNTKTTFIAVQHERGPRKSKLQGSKEHHGHHLHSHSHHSHHHHTTQLSGLNTNGAHLPVGGIIPQNMAAAGSFLAHQQAHHTNLAQAAAAHHQAAAASLHHSLAAAAAAKAALVGGNKILPPPPAPPPIIPGHPTPTAPPHPPFLFPFAALAAARHQQQQHGSTPHTIHHPTALFSSAFRLGIQPPPSSEAASINNSIISSPSSPIVSKSMHTSNRIDGFEAIPSNISTSPTNEQIITSLNQAPLATKTTQKHEKEIDIINVKPHLDIKKCNLEETSDKFTPFNISKHFPAVHLNNNNNE